MYRFERVMTDAVANAQHAALLASVFQKPALFTSDFIDWQYGQNPSGAIVGYNAFAESSGAEIAAHYVTQPFMAHIDGREEKGLLSLNTATHENHRGKGLFTKLADRTYQAAAEEGFGFVIGVANQNSVHGFISKLGFQLVGQLDAKLGIGDVPPSSGNQPYYERIWNPDVLKWRLFNPSASYVMCSNSATHYFAKTHLPLIKAELYSEKHEPVLPLAKSSLPFTLYIGLDRALNFKKGLFFDIPSRLRPAPLFLIFKDLTAKNRKLEVESLRFRLIDFDAY